MLVGKNITIWRPSRLCGYEFQPKDMLACTQVSRYFRDTLLPILWYIFDEMGSTTVPTEIIQKYTPYFRLHFNYGARQDYPTDSRVPSTHLIQLTMMHTYKERHDIEFIKSNPHLKRLEGAGGRDFNTINSDAFNNLQQLEHLHYYAEMSNHGSHQQLFQPISGTLRSLELVGMGCSLGLSGLVFPQVKELSMDFVDIQDAKVLLHACPNVESLKTADFSTYLTVLNLLRALEPGMCPTLKNMALELPSGLDTDLAVMLEGRTGLQSLLLNSGSISTRLVHAITRHSSSLTRLSIQIWGFEGWPIYDFEFVSEILSSCGQLKDVNLAGTIREIDSLMSSVLWKNPDVLERLGLQSNAMTLRGAPVKLDPATLLLGPPREVMTRVHELTTEPSLVIDPAISRWRRRTQIEGKSHNRAFLKAMFEIAEEYGRLRTIIINDVVYSKIEQR